MESSTDTTNRCPICADSSEISFGERRLRSQRRSGKKGYQHGYTVTSAFLLWLEMLKDPETVRKLNIAIQSKDYRSGIWRKHCRASIDEFWDEFLRYSVSQSKQ